MSKKMSETKKIELFEKIKSLRAQGKTWSQVADQLNSEKIRTVYNKSWAPVNVQSFYGRTLLTSHLATTPETTKFVKKTKNDEYAQVISEVAGSNLHTQTKQTLIRSLAGWIV